MDPIAKGWREATVPEDLDDACDVNIVEEALNVKKYHRCDEAGPDSGLCIVNQT